MIAAGHGWGIGIFPLIASVVALVFSFLLGRRALAKWRWHEAAWLVALLMYAAASFAMFLGVVRGWTPAEFRTYWLLGAVLNVPYLFLGEVYLLSRSRALAHVLAILLVIASFFAATKIGGAAVHRAALAKELPLGKDVFGDGSSPYRLAQFFSWPAYVLLLGALVWSVLAMKGKPHLRDRAAGTLGIAVGATIVAIGSGVGAAYSIVAVFALALAAGVAVMFAGFLRASRPPAA